jgi:hypothetical protein
LKHTVTITWTERVAGGRFDVLIDGKPVGRFSWMTDAFRDAKRQLTAAVQGKKVKAVCH